MRKYILRKSTLGILLICFLLPVASYSQRLSDTVKRIDALFKELNQQTPGAALRVTRGPQVLYSKGFGMSDLEHHIPITDETIFEAGSVSKQFTATAILLLVQEGKVDLDADIRTYIPEFPVYEKAITVRHLLNHTSGLRDWGVVASLGGWPRGTRVYTNERALNIILKQEGLNNVPGDEYLYSNSNYTLLTLIAERVSGQSLPEFTKERIFKPLGMTHTQWRNEFKAVVHDRAVGYDRVKGAFLSNMPFENTYGHAALLTNVKDLDIWNKSWKHSPLGGQTLLQLRTEQGRLNNGQEISYAAGVMVEEHNGHAEVSHSGATAGYRCWLAYYPNDNLSVVYLSNATYLSTVQTGEQVANIFFGADSEAPAKKAKQSNATYQPNLQALKAIEGVYYSDECGGTYILSVADGQLWLDDQVNDKVALRPTGKDSFKKGGAEYVFKHYGHNKQLFVTVGRARNVKFVRR